MRLFSKCISAALIASAFSASWAANTVTPQNGNWIIADEANGKPGRGMGIDVQDGVFMMQLYNYNKDGSPTFHFAAGIVENNKVTAPLKAYKNGPFFGSSPKNGEEASNAGDVSIEFTSRTTGIIQFPGEEPKAFRRFDFEGTQSQDWSDPAYVERWAMVEMDEKNQPINTYWADIGLGSQMAMSPAMNPAWPYSSSEMFTMHTHDLATPKKYGFLECQALGENRIFECSGEQRDNGTRQPIEIKMQRSIDQLEGTITTADDSKPRRVIGMRVEKSSYALVNNKITTTAHFRRHSQPEAGTWIVSDEVTGLAGRGISLDLQKPVSGKHMLFMPVYNYDSDGKATFHLAMGTHSISTTPEPETPALRLMKYKNGRYLGGPAQSGEEGQYAGSAQVSFNSPATGTVQFPDEEMLRIQRLYFGIAQESIDSLVGTWALTPYDGNLKHRILKFVKTTSGVVEDKEAGYSCHVNYWLSHRFVCEPKFLSSDQPRIRFATGWYGPARAITGDGGPLPNSTNEMAIMRISDGDGNQVYAGPLYPTIEVNTSTNLD